MKKKKICKSNNKPQDIVVIGNPYSACKGEEVTRIDDEIYFLKYKPVSLLFEDAI